MKRILIVDDEPHMIRVMKMALERASYYVDVAPNGVEALKKIHGVRPDVVIIDISMPLMTGEELCKQIEIDITDRDFLIIVARSRTEIEHREWSREMQNLQFFEKPISTRKLMLVLDEYFTAKPSSAEHLG